MKVNIKKSLPCIITSAFYTIWHIAYLVIIIHAHKILRAAVETNTIEQGAKEAQIWSRYGNFMVSFTRGGAYQKWRFIILIFLAVIIFYGVRYAIVTYLSANILAFTSITLFKFICDLDASIMIGPANYYIHIFRSLRTTSRALLIAIILSLPLVLYRQYRKHRKQ